MTLSLARFFSRLITRKSDPTPEIDWRDKMRDEALHMGPQPTAEAADRARRGLTDEQRAALDQLDTDCDAAYAARDAEDVMHPNPQRPNTRHDLRVMPISRRAILRKVR